MQQSGFWSKVRHWINPDDAQADRDRSARSELGGDDELPGKPATTAAAVSNGGSLLLSKRRRQEAAVEKLQDSFVQVVDLIESVRKHQVAQETHAGKMSSALTQMADSLGDIQDGARTQGQTLANIVTELQVANERSQRWQETVSELPAIARANQQALQGVTEQIEAAAQRDERLVESLGTFGDAVASLGDATTASSVAVSGLQAAMAESDERTIAMIQEQSKRFTMLFVVTLVLAAIAVATSVSLLWR